MLKLCISYFDIVKMPNITKTLNMTKKYKIQKHSFTRLPWHEWEIDFSWENDVIWHLDPPPPPSKKNAPVPNFFDPLPPSLPPPPLAAHNNTQTFYSSLWLEMAASAFFTHGYLQQAHVHISEAINWLNPVIIDF